MVASLFGQEHINDSEWQKRAVCPFAVPSVAQGGCWLQRSGAATLPWGSGLQQDTSCLGELVLQHGFLLHWLHWAGRVAGEKRLLPSNVGVLLLVPVHPGRSPAVSRMDARPTELPVNSSADWDTDFPWILGISSGIYCCWLSPKQNTLIGYDSLDSNLNTHKNRNLNMTFSCYSIVFLFPQYKIHSSGLLYYD